MGSKDQIAAESAGPAPRPAHHLGGLEEHEARGAAAAADDGRWAAQPPVAAALWVRASQVGDVGESLELATSMGAPFAVVGTPHRASQAAPTDAGWDPQQHPQHSQQQAAGQGDDQRPRCAQLQLRDAIFAGVLEPLESRPPGPSAAGDAGRPPPPSPPTPLDPLALLRMSMLNPEMPLASPPSAGAGAGGALSGGLGAAAAGAGGSGAGVGRAAAATTAAAADKGVGCDEEMTWQRRRRVSAVVREELAEVAKALEAGLPQASRPLRRQTSFPAMRGPEDSPQTHLIPTPSGPPSGAATPGMSSPVVGIAGNGNGGSSSNIGYRSAWQQQQPRLLRASLLQDVQAAPPAAVGRKRPADAAAEQLAAKVLAAHKGNWVSALHKLASAVGRQLQNARDAPSLESDGPDSRGAGDHQQQQAPHPGPQPQLTEPEIAAREARLKRVLVHGTRAARAVATQGPGAAGGVHASASAAAAGQQWQQLQLDQQQQQQQLPATPAFQNTQRQLQLGPHDQPPGGPPGAADSPLGCLPPGPALPQAWNASAPMPHQRPRPGPSRLAHQSSLQAWDTAFQEEAAALEQAEALYSAEAPPAQLARPPSPQDPVLRLQQLHLQQVQLALLGQPAPEFRPDVAAAAAGQLPSAAPAALLQQRLAAYLDEPIISLKEARREARSRSSTPAFGTPRAGPAAAAAASHPFGAAPAAGCAAAMDVDAGHGAGAPGHQMDEEDDEGDDPIAAQLAGAAGAAGCGDLDLAGTERFDFDLVEPEAAAAVGAGGGGGGGGGHVVPVTGELAQLRPHQLARAAHHYHQQQVVLQQHAQLQAAHLQVQGAALVPQAPAEVKCEDGAVAFGAALQLQLQPQLQPRPPSPQ